MNIIPLLFSAAFLVGCSQSLAPPPSPEQEKNQAQNSESTIPTGSFESPSHLCSTLYGDGNCSKEMKDCLSVTPEENGDFLVNLYSIQANNHTCSMSLPMRLTEGVLVYNNNKDNFTIRVENKDGMYIIITDGTASTDDNIYCGAHASIDGYQIQNLSRSESVNSCPSPDDL